MSKRIPVTMKILAFVVAKGAAWQLGREVVKVLVGLFWPT
jgi:hypothetical protein